MDKFSTEELEEVKRIHKEFIEDIQTYAENLATVEPFVNRFKSKQAFYDGLLEECHADDLYGEIELIDEEIERRKREVE